MDVCLTRRTAGTGRVEDPPVFVVELSGTAGPLGIDYAFDAIMSLGRKERDAHIIADMARVQSRSAAGPMLDAASVELGGRLSVVGG